MPDSSLGELQQLIMLAVLRLGPDAYGARIRRELRTVAQRKVSISAIYVTLVRLEEQGLSRSHPGETPATGGRPRRCFELTPRGEKLLRTTRAAANRMWVGVDA